MPLLSPLAGTCLRIINKAEKELGPDLAGYSPLDLVCDSPLFANSFSTKELKIALAELGYEQYEGA